MGETEESKNYMELLLVQLKTLNTQVEASRINFDEKFKLLDDKLNQYNTKMNIEIEKNKSNSSNIEIIGVWKERVSEVMSPTQMKQLKDEVYKQKNKWTATIAILIFIEVVAFAIAGFIKFN